MSYLVEFDVADDLTLPGCPVCRATNRAGWDYVSGLLREDVNNPRVQDQLDRTNGLCREHLLLAARVARHEEDTLGLSMLVEFLLEMARRKLDRFARATQSASAKRRRLRRGSARPDRLLPRDCPACEAEERRASAYLDILVEAPAGSDVGTALSDPARGLCLPHLVAGLGRDPDPETRARLVRAYQGRADVLRAQVTEHIRKQAHRHGSEQPGPEAAGWQEGAEWLVGAGRCMSHPSG